MVNVTEKLIEYRRVRHSAASEASSYLTNHTAEVSLCFPNPIVCQMMRGHKIMRVNGSKPFDFLPGEAMLVAPGMPLEILFPEASPEDPTECICIEIDRSQVDEIVERVNQGQKRLGLGGRFSLDWTRFAVFRKDLAILGQMNKLMMLYRDEKSPFRDVLVDLGHEELVLRILQAQSRELLVEQRTFSPTTGLDVAAEMLRDNPRKRYAIEELAQIACMSEATFFRRFKARFGVTPAKFANDCRIHRARALLATAPVAEVAFDLGFASVEHFSRLFRQVTGETPGGIRKRLRPDVRAYIQ
ncbi:AraC family transcriptional regulator [Agrobacterium rhizogenes]|uniref:AraC family transcriptional regulator n=1 Tax=Rhizobium rhizogenes NBRC 13257 TaxID=1220581 RepID=A0AA87QD14_RHIRH|nr:AraC family transcriptional regulator [Rhizobium rhizogenes]NTF59561.1 AraC family transcriptional regulator [Rhizobium rhizogenes]NTF65862.1 AraC family transcriptional regulator [Rhizobium rhizogenes]NTF79121.1 AraC family transcriptional regulator [Rhizobium rhizogenes]NTF97983.1 AraC family transcriptional regulator [Rhizobium rhizogenes]NTG25191.1 AraC family transcriptional regulator [Rhizobium rhizogenes]